MTSAPRQLGADLKVKIVRRDQIGHQEQASPFSSFPACVLEVISCYFIVHLSSIGSIRKSRMETTISIARRNNARGSMKGFTDVA